jgi:ADP-ribose pyrophosphatase YjhB (NUDIX family)
MENLVEARSPEACPHCGGDIKLVKRPLVTVDIIIEYSVNGHEIGIVLIERRYPPHGWALPGGFVEYGETTEEAAVREAKEETSLDVSLGGLLGLYSDPSRDPRGHTISAVYLASGSGQPKARDDAMNLKIYPLDGLPDRLAFDHSRIISEYIGSRVT